MSALNKNHLQHETSLYLQQHAGNPVDWFPWSDEAFKKAQNEDKLLLISIGYSSCHWCHVMEHEVFENEVAARVLNEHFVCIKVDREERPDVDNVYMTAVQLMTQSGGWPLNCVTLPDGRPIFGATYLPLEQFLQNFQLLADLYQNDRQKVTDFAQTVQEGMQEVSLVVKPLEEPFEAKKLHTLVSRWSQAFDLELGGMKQAPKFPMPNNYAFLLDYGNYFQQDGPTKFTHLTWHKILQGGIYDQVEGGLMRYSTDRMWKVPHFEKMLYDNAQFLSFVSKAHIDYPSTEYQHTLGQTVEWLVNKMKDEDGFYKSSIDADAGGEEGLFYTWKLDELKEVLGHDYEDFAKIYALNGDGFWKEGEYILLRKDSVMECVDKVSLPPTAFFTWLNHVHRKLLQRRSERPNPTIDGKIVFAWNCLLAIGFIDTAIAFADGKYVRLAKDLTKKLERRFVTIDGILRISTEKGDVNGFLDDYAFYIQLCIRMHQYTLDEDWLRKAKYWLKVVEEKFQKQQALFYYSEGDHLLMSKTIEIEDNVIPSSNSVLANCYWDLGVLEANEKFMQTAKDMLQCVYPNMDQFGSMYSNWAILLVKVLKGDLLVNYLGDIFHETHIRQMKTCKEVALFRKSQEVNDRPRNYEICYRKACSAPKEDPETILAELTKILQAGKN